MCWVCTPFATDHVDSTWKSGHVTSHLLCCRYLCVVARRIYKTRLEPSTPWWFDHVILVEVADSGEKKEIVLLEAFITQMEENYKLAG